MSLRYDNAWSVRHYSRDRKSGVSAPACVKGSRGRQLVATSLNMYRMLFTSDSQQGDPASGSCFTPKIHRDVRT